MIRRVVLAVLVALNLLAVAFELSMRHRLAELREPSTALCGTALADCAPLPRGAEVAGAIPMCGYRGEAWPALVVGRVIVCRHADRPSLVHGTPPL